LAGSILGASGRAGRRAFPRERDLVSRWLSYLRRAWGNRAILPMRVLIDRAPSTFLKIAIRSHDINYFNILR
jgi:hypothetical protein